MIEHLPNAALLDLRIDLLRHGSHPSNSERCGKEARAVQPTREELRIAVVTWIERTYHRRRRQAALGRLTPIEYEAIMTSTATQAA
jgi:transposase InsO family protein